MKIRKNIQKTASILLFALFFSSCDDFLKMTPRDKKIVKTVEDYRDIMASYMKFITTPNPTQERLFGLSTNLFPAFDVSQNIAVYTGENILPTTNDYFDADNNQYTASGVRMLSWLVTDAYIWNKYYKFLGPINMIISDIDNVKATDSNIRNFVKGEALVWRAYAYFKLLQYYAPYKKENYGIPLYLTPSENIGVAMPKRETQTTVYQQILKDCNNALQLLKETPTTDWNCAYRADFIHAMLASIYNYKALSGAASNDDWKNAETHANIAMKGRMLSKDTETLKQMFDCSKEMADIRFQNDEFFFRLMGGRNNSHLFRFNHSYYGYLYSTGSANSKYLKMFEDTDRRKSFYFASNNTLNDKYNMLSMSKTDEGGCLLPFRLAELYLIKAEAAHRQGKIALANTTLQEFQNSRYTTTQAAPSNAKELLAEILIEKKREFYLENDFIWIEMKRLGEEITRTVNGESITLQSDDFRYAFPIPVEEIKRNKNMKQNPGWETIVF